METIDTNNDETNDLETKEFVKKKNKYIFENQIKNKKVNKKSVNIWILIIFSFLIFLLILLITYHLIKENKIQDNENIISMNSNKSSLKETIIQKENLSILNITYSPKWIVITTINMPNTYIHILLLSVPDPWKIVVIGDIKTNNASWAKFKNSSKLIYLSIEDQLKLNYNITKYIPFNSYSRKNIGYLYAIQHGAKEIYETDDNIYMFNRKNFLNRYIEKYIYYAENNNSLMINPYNFYGKPTIWPRGFKLKDIDKESDTKFYRLISGRTKLNPLIFQGLLNLDPDVDSIFRQTRLNNKNSMNQIFYGFRTLMYLPGNFVPINSKNTKYLYDIFPCLALPITVSKRVSDIWRGYLMQRYVWIYNGTVLYTPPNADNKRKYCNITLDFINEKDLFYKLDDLLNSLNIDIDEKIKNPSEFLINLIEILIDKGFLGENDLNIYKAFIDDLNYIGYNYNLKFDRKIERDHKKLLNTYSEFNFMLSRQNKIVLQNNNMKNITLFKHKNSQKKYDDILLIINYNYKFLTVLNDYMLKLYHEYFPHIIFIYPGIIDNNETFISCPESFKGYYSYKCIEKVYVRYPNKSGYLFLMDDNFLKVWELENFDFTIPWFNSFFIKKRQFDDRSYIKAKQILDINLNWKKRYRNFLGSLIVAYAVSDIYYIPKEDISTFCNMIDSFYSRRVFLETAVPTMMGIMLKPRYQIIFFVGLWKEGRKNIIKHLKKEESQITIHPIKFSNLTYQEEVNKYIFIMNGLEY